jgi:hypothetical protein
MLTSCANFDFIFEFKHVSLALGISSRLNYWSTIWKRLYIFLYPPTPNPLRGIHPYPNHTGGHTQYIVFYATYVDLITPLKCVGHKIFSYC